MILRTLDSAAAAERILEERRPELRSKAAAVVVLSSLLRGLDMHPDTAVYLACHHGPVHARTQELVLAGEPIEVAERALPPKDYFVSNPSMKAAQLSMEFGFHGPWTAFTRLEQAKEHAQSDLEDGVVPAAVVACAEELVAMYVTKPEEL